jgi:hypothetical protein
METANAKSQRVQGFWFFWLPLIVSVVVFLVLATWVESSYCASAQEQHQRIFPSAEHASHALFAAPSSKDDRSKILVYRATKNLR